MPQNIAGLINQMGGTVTFVNRLNTFFTKLNDGDGSSYEYIGNKPTFQTAWLYDWAGAPAQAQAVVRRMIAGHESLFVNAPDGTPGNDDWGAMSSWYVWALYWGCTPKSPAWQDWPCIVHCLPR